MSDWKEELDAIVGARAHGQAEEILPRLQKLDARHPNVAEISYQLAWTCDVLDRAADALRLALDTLCETTDDPGLTAYQRAIRHAAAKL